jgi:hypothetical protein
VGSLKNYYIENKNCRFSFCDCEPCIDAENSLAEMGKPSFNSQGLLKDPNTGMVFKDGEWCDTMNTAEWLVFNGFNNIQLGA